MVTAVRRPWWIVGVDLKRYVSKALLQNAVTCNSRASESLATVL